MPLLLDNVSQPEPEAGPEADLLPDRVRVRLPAAFRLGGSDSRGGTGLLGFVALASLAHAPQQDGDGRRVLAAACHPFVYDRPSVLDFTCGMAEEQRERLRDVPAPIM